jgi:manganese transport protein
MSQHLMVHSANTTAVPSPESTIYDEELVGLIATREKSWWDNLLKVFGPGFVVAIGYMDPGNWATDLAGGSTYGYTLLSIIFLSNFMAIFLQSLCVRLGVLTGKDLAQVCRDQTHPYLNILLYILAEFAMIATDLAEIIGGAIALELLFGLPLKYGIVLTCVDVFLILMLWKPAHQNIFNFFIFIVVLIVFGIFAALVVKTEPVVSEVLMGYIPTTEIFTNSKMLYIALGIMGATVMPHNLYVHSHLVKDFDDGDMTPSSQISRKEQSVQIGYRIIEVIVALMFAVLINSGILIVAAAGFHEQGIYDVAEISDAYDLLEKLLGKPYAVIFAVALLLCAQASSITGTMAGQIVMEGHLGPSFKVAPWIRRSITRLLAIVPAMIVAIVGGDAGVNNLLVLSQVMLSVQLPFAVWPLVYFTSSINIIEGAKQDGIGRKHIFVNMIDERKKPSQVMTVMGVIIALILTFLNGILLIQSLY